MVPATSFQPHTPLVAATPHTVLGPPVLLHGDWLSFASLSAHLTGSTSTSPTIFLSALSISGVSPDSATPWSGGKCPLDSH